MWIWLIIGLVLVVLLLDRVIERMYAYEVKPPRRTPAKYDIPFENLRLPLENGQTLAAWWIPGRADAPALVLVHGWGRNRERMQRYIQHLHPLGYNLLAFDARAHGESDPTPHPTIWTFTEDTRAAIRWLETQHPNMPIGIIGLSIGGGAAINAASQLPQVRAVVTVGAVGHPGQLMDQQMAEHHLPAILRRALLTFMRWRYGLDFKTIAPVNNIQRVSAQCLLIHGMQDDVVPLAQVQALLDNAPAGRAERWLVPEKGHSDCCTHPDFWPRVDAFLQRHLPAV